MAIRHGHSCPAGARAPYVGGLTDGRLLLTSNNHHVSISADDGQSWQSVTEAFRGGPEVAFFSAIYQSKPDELMTFTGLKRADGGRRIAVRFGALRPR